MRFTEEEQHCIQFQDRLASLQIDPLAMPFCARQLSCCEDELNNIVDAGTKLDAGKDRGPAISHLVCVSLHDFQRCTHMRRQINLVDDENVRLRDAWASFSGHLWRDVGKRVSQTCSSQRQLVVCSPHLVAASNVNHIDVQVGQFRAIRGRQVVTTTLHKQQFAGVFGL